MSLGTTEKRYGEKTVEYTALKTVLASIPGGVQETVYHINAITLQYLCLTSLKQNVHQINIS